MSTSYLPGQITKDVLFEKAQERFQSWAKMYGDPNVSAQYMYEDMSCSVFSGDPSDDFPEIVGPKKDEPICYQYKEGGCFFILDGIEFMVADLRDMRKSECTHTECYFDICTLVISIKDTDGIYKSDLIPGAWLYGSTSEDFNEGQKVHTEFIEAAKKYIEEHHITKEMQEVKE